ncbi:hypothetical protein BLNAU_9687 [Blattamonas nauphoetae]|uniref:Uncharacterized protein n=1 Tax=Blattamonas nauphoetae TaxID=2049346 RepID=A0ABQ9XUZ7_9EUKA|nr:hypothetical protein BLNAU_9687 [Blattamonas nauphoetae]
MDWLMFLNWDESQDLSESENAVVFRSLVAQMKPRPVFDDTLEEKAVKLLEFMTPTDRESADAFLNNFGPSRDDSLTVFVQSIEVLMSSSSQTITKSAMKMLEALVVNCSTKVRFALIKADLIPQLINTLNPQALSFATAVDIHTSLIGIIINTVWLSTPGGLTELGIEDRDEQQSVHETVLQQVVVTSEKYICHLCVNRFSIVDGQQSRHSLTLLTQIIRTSPYHQRTINFVLRMPIVLTIPSCLAFFVNDWEWNRIRGDEQQMWKRVHRMLRMEGIEDAIETKLQNNKSTLGRRIIAKSIDLNTLQDCSSFLNWHYNAKESELEKAVVFRSLVATVKSQPAFDESLEAKAIQFLKSVRPSQTITAAAMEMLSSVFTICSADTRLALVKADLVPKLISILNPQSLSFTKAVDIHHCLISSIQRSVWLATPDNLRTLEIVDGDEKQNVHETVFQQVLIPSEKYICHLCGNRFSIVDGDQSMRFMSFLANLVEISLFYQPTMDFVLRMPVTLTIPSSLTFFHNDTSIWQFLHYMNKCQREWNKTRGREQQMWRIVHLTLGMEGIEDVMETKLQNNKKSGRGLLTVAESIGWINVLGMNHPGHLPPLFSIFPLSQHHSLALLLLK